MAQLSSHDIIDFYRASNCGHRLKPNETKKKRKCRKLGQKYRFELSSRNYSNLLGLKLKAATGRRKSFINLIAPRNDSRKLTVIVLDVL